MAEQSAKTCGTGLFGRVCCCARPAPEALRQFPAFTTDALGFMSGRTPAYLAGETEHLLGGVARTTPSEKERELARGRRLPSFLSPSRRALAAAFRSSLARV